MSRNVTVALTLDAEEAMALAQLAKRFSWEDAKRLSNAHDGGGERDTMLDAVGRLARALASAGFAPR